MFGSQKARGSDLCMQLSTQLSTQFTDSTKKGRALLLIPPHVSSGFPHFRPQRSSPELQPSSPWWSCCLSIVVLMAITLIQTHQKEVPLSRTKSRCEGVGTERKKWALSRLSSYELEEREKKILALPHLQLEPGKGGVRPREKDWTC